MAFNLASELGLNKAEHCVEKTVCSIGKILFFLKNACAIFSRQMARSYFFFKTLIEHSFFFSVIQQLEKWFIFQP